MIYSPQVGQKNQRWGMVKNPPKHLKHYYLRFRPPQSSGASVRNVINPEVTFTLMERWEHFWLVSSKSPFANVHQGQLLNTWHGQPTAILINLRLYRSGRDGNRVWKVAACRPAEIQHVPSVTSPVNASQRGQLESSARVILVDQC